MKQKYAIIEISDILTTTPGGVFVRFKESNQKCWLSRRYSEFLPGHVRIPVWLAEKIRQKNGQQQELFINSRFTRRISGENRGKNDHI